MKRNTLEIAREASDFARKEILRGSTQIENNDCDSKQQFNYLHAVDGLREQIKDALERDPYRLEQDLEIHYFTRSTKIAAKYSLGNCSEMSFHALLYMVREAPDISAELYQIANGDHTFLVIGRNGGTREFPKTWGKNAVICDPWANKVYPAHQYKEHLKNFSQEVTKSEVKNNSHDFELGVHRIAPLGFCKSRTLIARNNNKYISNLIDVYQQKMQIIIDALTELKTDLNELCGSVQLTKPHKNLVLYSKQEQIQKIIDALNAVKDAYNEDSFENYDTADETLRDSLKDAIKQLRHCYYFSKQDYSTLSSFKDTQLVRLFKSEPSMLDKTNAAFQKASACTKRLVNFNFD